MQNDNQFHTIREVVNELTDILNKGRKGIIDKDEVQNFTNRFSAFNDKIVEKERKHKDAKR